MEFGISPFPEPRRRMVERASLFGTPTYRWLGAKRRLTAEYYAGIAPADAIPADLTGFENLL
jgi:hypothetical protein